MTEMEVHVLAECSWGVMTNTGSRTLVGTSTYIHVSLSLSTLKPEISITLTTSVYQN